MRERCPICRAEALYVGLERLDCPTEHCPNYRENERVSEIEQMRRELDQLMYELWCRAQPGL